MGSVKKRDFSIGETSRRSGVSVKQIHDWEKKGYIPPLPRIRFGMKEYRSFTNEDVAFIKKIKFYLDNGYTLKVSALKAKTCMPKGKGTYDD